MKLIDTLPRHKNFKNLFHNSFCSLPLCLSLKEKGFLTVATIRSDSVQKCPLPCKKDLKKTG